MEYLLYIVLGNLAACSCRKDMKITILITTWSVLSTDIYNKKTALFKPVLLIFF